MRIESTGGKTGKAHVIKSHHNVGELPAEMVHRQQFRGPGLGVRIVGEVTQAAADTLREADHIFIEELRKARWYEKTAQAFAVFFPVKSVGVTGDGRRHEPVIALRAVQTVGFMTAHWAPLPYQLLDVCSRRTVNEVKGVSQVVYYIGANRLRHLNGSSRCGRRDFCCAHRARELLTDNSALAQRRKRECQVESEH